MRLLEKLENSQIFGKLNIYKFLFMMREMQNCDAFLYSLF